MVRHRTLSSWKKGLVIVGKKGLHFVPSSLLFDRKVRYFTNRLTPNEPPFRRRTNLYQQRTLSPPHRNVIQCDARCSGVGRRWLAWTLFSFLKNTWFAVLQRDSRHVIRPCMMSYFVVKYSPFRVTCQEVVGGWWWLWAWPIFALSHAAWVFHFFAGPANSCVPQK